MIKKLSAFAITVIILIGISIFMRMPKKLPPDTTIPYFLMQLCVDGESGAAIESYNGQEDRKKFADRAVRIGVKKCNLVINDLAILIAKTVKEKKHIKTLLILRVDRAKEKSRLIVLCSQ